MLAIIAIWLMAVGLSVLAVALTEIFPAKPVLTPEQVAEAEAAWNRIDASMASLQSTAKRTLDGCADLEFEARLTRHRQRQLQRKWDAAKLG
jgi:hypothetical protein